MHTVRNTLSFLTLFILAVITVVIFPVLAYVHLLEPVPVALVGVVASEIALLLAGWITAPRRIQLGFYILVAGSLFGGMGGFLLSGGLTISLLATTIGLVLGGIGIVIFGLLYFRKPARRSLIPFVLVSGLICAGIWGYWLTGGGTLQQVSNTSDSNRVAISPDGKTLVIGSYTSDLEVSEVNVWAGKIAPDGIPRTVPRSTPDGYAYLMLFSSDGKTLASYQDEHVALWDVQTWTIRNSVPIITDEYGISDDQVAAFSRDSSTIALGNWNSTTISFWDVQSGMLRSRIESDDTLIVMSFSPDDSILATGGLNYLNLWDLAHGNLRHHLDSKFTGSLAFSPDGTLLATAGRNHSISVWDLPSRTLRYVLSGCDDYLAEAVAFSPNGRMLASAGSHFTVQLWNVEAGTLYRTLSGGPNVGFTFSEDGQSLMSHSGSIFCIWNINTVPIFDYGLLIGGLSLLASALISIRR